MPGIQSPGVSRCKSRAGKIPVSGFVRLVCRGGLWLLLLYVHPVRPASAAADAGRFILAPAAQFLGSCAAEQARQLAVVGHGKQRVRLQVLLRPLQPFLIPKVVSFLVFL